MYWLVIAFIFSVFTHANLGFSLDKSRRAEKREYRSEKRDERRNKDVEEQPDDSAALNTEVQPPIQIIQPSDKAIVTSDEALAQVRRTRQAFSNLIINLEKSSPWKIVHALLGFGWNMKMQVNAQSQPINAFVWLISGSMYKDKAVFEMSPSGPRGHTAQQSDGGYGPGYEGHPNQFIGYLSEFNLPQHHVIRSYNGGRWEDRKVSEYVEYIKRMIDRNHSDRVAFEKTWSLWTLARLSDPDMKWVSNAGAQWSVQKLLKEESEAPVTKQASCAGMHRAYAVTLGVQAWEKKHGEAPQGSITYNAGKKVREWIQRAQDFQLHNGSLSADHLESKKDPETLGRQIAANGHVLEFLMLALEDFELEDMWVSRAVYAVAYNIGQMRNNWEGYEGSVFHGLHALKMYDERMAKIRSGKNVAGSK